MIASRVLVRVTSSSGKSHEGQAQVSVISERQAFWRGGRRSAKLIGIGMLALLPFGIMEPFLFMIWGSIAFGILVLLVGPFLHMLLSSETRSFSEVQCPCPQCEAPGPLRPYVSTRFEPEFTVLCPACGQTSRAFCDADALS